MNLSAIDSILIVRLSAIGDVIHALPILDALRKAKPDARIGWVVEELSAPLLENHPQLDKVYVIPKKRWKKDFRGLFFSEIRPFFKQIKADGWDAAIDLQGLTKSGLVAYFSGAKVRVGYGDKDGRELNKLFTNRKVSPDSKFRHVVERNLSLLRGLEIVPDFSATGKLGILEKEKVEMRAKLVEAGWNREERLLAINPGAGWVTKRWEPAKYARAAAGICREEGLRPLVLWGPGEEKMRDKVAEGLSGLDLKPVIAPNTRIRELAVLISLCTKFLGGDTGPTHMAGLLGLDTISIFGASDRHRNRPWPVDAGPALQLEDLYCVPCWKRECPLEKDEYLQCLRKLEPEAVTGQATR